MTLSVLAGRRRGDVAGRRRRRAAARAESETNRQIAVRDLYSEAMQSLSVTAAEHPEAFTRPNVITQALQDTLHDMAPRYARTPSQHAAQLHSVMLQLNYNSEFEASLAVGREYLAFLKANDGSVLDIVFVYSVIGRNLARLKRYEECEAVRRAGLAWKPDVDKDDAAHAGGAPAAGDRLRQLSHLPRQARRGEDGARHRAGARARARSPTRPPATRTASPWPATGRPSTSRARCRPPRPPTTGSSGDKTLDPDQRATFLKSYSAALLDNGRNAEAEKVLQSSRELYTQAYGATSLNATAGAGFVAIAIARQGDYQRANRVLAEQRRVLEAARGGVDPALGRLLLERQLEVDWLAGDVRPCATTCRPTTR